MFTSQNAVSFVCICFTFGRESSKDFGIVVTKVNYKVCSAETAKWTRTKRSPQNGDSMQHSNTATEIATATHWKRYLSIGARGEIDVFAVF